MENNSYESEFMCSSNPYCPPPHTGGASRAPDWGRSTATAALLTSPACRASSGRSCIRLFCGCHKTILFFAVWIHRNGIGDMVNEYVILAIHLL